MLYAIYFALHFAMIFLGLVTAIHFDTWLGVTLIVGFIYSILWKYVYFFIKYLFLYKTTVINNDNDKMFQICV